MTEATEHEWQRETDEADTNVRYSDETLSNETLNGETLDRDAYDRDRNLDRSDLDRTDAERAGMGGSDVRASDPAQPGTAPDYRDRSGYDAVAGQDPVADQPDGGNVSAADDPDVLMSRWHEAQTGFVDDPRQSVQEADGLVQQVMQQVSQRLASERADLEQA